MQRGWPGSTLITVRVTNSAVDAVSGNALYSPWQMQFHTAALSTLIPPAISLQTPTNGAVIAGNLQISGTASDTVAVQQVEVQLDNGIWTTAAGTTSWSLSLNSSNFLNGPHVISARATDTSGNVSNTTPVSVWFFNVPGSYVQRVSGGNPANVTDCSGNVWLEDTNYTLGAFGYSARHGRLFGQFDHWRLRVGAVALPARALQHGAAADFFISLTARKAFTK